MKLISIPNFLPPGSQAIRSSLLPFIFLGHSESTKLNFIRKVLYGTTRKFFAYENSFTVLLKNRFGRLIFLLETEQAKRACLQGSPRELRKLDYGRITPPPLETILVIFGRRALIFLFVCLKVLGKIWKITPLLCACAVVITLETQKCWKRAPSNFTFLLIAMDKRFSQNERRRADPQNSASDFSIFAWGLSYDLSKFSDDFTPFFFFRLWKTITKSLGKN